MTNLEVIRVHGINNSKAEVAKLTNELAATRASMKEWARIAENLKEEYRVTQETAEMQNKILQACWDAAEGKPHVVVSDISTNLVYKAVTGLRENHDSALDLLNKINSIIGEWMVPHGITSDAAMQELLQFDNHPMMLKAAGDTVSPPQPVDASLDGGFRLGERVTVLNRGITEGMITSLLLENDGEVVFDVKNLLDPNEKTYFDIPMSELQHV